MSVPENPLLVLGSGSPRRAALMQQIGLPFVQWNSAAAEPDHREGPPAAYALETARLKARAVQQAVRSYYGPDRPTIVIGADTVVHLDGAVLSKPADQADAARMLRLLAGRTHQVYMRPLSAAQIDRYLASGETADKAGAYGIQGSGALLIERIEGCYYNVVGLPLTLLCTLLERAGYDFSIPP